VPEMSQTQAEEVLEMFRSRDYKICHVIMYQDKPGFNCRLFPFH